MRTGISSSTLSRRPLLNWILELGPIIASPVIDKGILYVTTITGRIFAINIYNRQIKWHWNASSPLISTPLLREDLVISATFDKWINDTPFLGKNLIFAIDVTTGRQRWFLETDADVFSSPCIANNMIIIGSLNKNLLAIDMDGTLRWTFETQGKIWSSPSFSWDNIFVGSDDGHLYCVDLDGKMQWKIKLDEKIRSSPCISYETGTIFIGSYDGTLYCLNQHDGTIRWKKQITKPVLSSAALLNDKVYFGTSDNKMYCINCFSGSLIWEFETGDKIWSSPVINKKRETILFGSLDSHIYEIDTNTGKQIWKFPTMDSIDSSPCISNEMLFVGGRDGLLYVFGSRNSNTYIG